MSSLRRALAALLRGSSVGVRARLRACPEIERERARGRARSFMHTNHHRGVICYARAARRLSAGHRLGLLAHEVGHLLALRRLGPGHRESAADAAARRYLGVVVEYRQMGKYGRRGLQWARRA